MDEYDAIQSYREVCLKIYIPRFKYQLVDWLSNWYNESKSHFNKKRINQLYVIYLKTRRKYEYNRFKRLSKGI